MIFKDFRGQFCLFGVDNFLVLINVNLWGIGVPVWQFVLQKLFGQSDS